MEWLRNTYKKGCTLATCPGTYFKYSISRLQCSVFFSAVENVQNRVKGLLGMVQDWEQRTRAALKEKYVHIHVYVHMFYVPINAHPPDLHAPYHSLRLCWLELKKSRL